MFGYQRLNLAAENSFETLSVRVIDRKGSARFEFRESRGIFGMLKQTENSLRYHLRTKIQEFGRKCESS